MSYTSQPTAAPATWLARPTAVREHAWAVRLAGFLAAAVLAGRILLSRGEPVSVETWLRIAETSVALAVGLTASPRRSPRELNGLALALLLDVAVVSAVRLGLANESVWESGVILVGVLLSAVFLVNWSWRWQLALAGFVIAVAAVALGWPGGGSSRRQSTFLLSLLGAGMGSVLGVWLVQRRREALAASEARYRALFAGALDAILIVDAVGKVTECNPAFGRLIRRRVEDVIGTDAGVYLSPLQPSGKTGAEVFEQFFRLALGGEHEMVTCYLLRADGSELEAEMTCSRVETPQGWAVQAVIRDLTEHRTLERRLARERRIESLGRLAGGISYQFNNLMAGILTHAATLRVEMIRDEHADVLDEVADAARRGRDLARELVRFAQYESLVLRKVAPAAVLERVATVAKGAVVDGVTIQLELPQGLPDIAADLDELVHAVLQVVVNARDAMPEGGTVVLSGQAVEVQRGDPGWPGAAPGDYVWLTVRDTGKGMDAATRDRAFEPFWGSKPRYEAAGIGLPAVHGIVRAHKGLIRIDSSPGLGTAIHLLIPVWKEAEVPVEPHREPGPGQARATVLVVDDEAIIRHSVHRALSRLGYRVLEAEDASGAAAQFAAADPPVDLVILDIVFPGGARRVFRELREQRPGLPILVSSGLASREEETIQALLSWGACGFLRKPYEVDELRHAVAQALGESDD